jgi:hypothetical protein
VRNAENEEQATLKLSTVQVNGEMRNVTTSDARADTQKDRAETGKKTGIGAAAGAVIGAVTGVGVVKGAVLGAGGGLAWGLLSGRDREVDQGRPRREAPGPSFCCQPPRQRNAQAGCPGSGHSKKAQTGGLGPFGHRAADRGGQMVAPGVAAGATGSGYPTTASTIRW